MQIFQVVKMVSSLAQMNFRRWPILCTTLYRNPIQAIATNFGGTFDQIFFYIFYAGLTEDAFLLFLYYGAKKKVKDDQKLKSKGEVLPE